MKITLFISGGRGFIGRNLIENLSHKYNILAPTHKELELLDEKKVESYLKKHRINVVIHAANVGGNRKDQFIPNMLMTNLKIFFNLARCDKYFKKMIFLGSGAEYDKTRDLKKIKETDFDFMIPQDDYGFYKYICSKYIEKSDKIINLRIFGLYGKHEDYKTRFISNAICKNIFNFPITMRQNVFFDYLYIDDFIKIIDYFINNDCEYKFYNVGRGEKIDLLTIAKMVNKISGKKSKIVIKKPGLKKEYTCDSSRLVHEVRNLHFTDFEETIKELYEWYKSIKSSLSMNSFLVDK